MKHLNFAMIGGNTKVSKNRYIKHQFIIDLDNGSKKLTLATVVESPLKTGKKYNFLTKSTVVKTSCGKLLKIINKPAHALPAGKTISLN